MNRIIRWVMRKRGVICMMCQDAIATEAKQLCKECADELQEIEMHHYHRDMQELYFR